MSASSLQFERFGWGLRAAGSSVMAEPSATVAEAPPEPGALVESNEPVPPSNYPGLIIQTDDEARLRSDVIMAITLCERRRLQADQDVNRAADFMKAIVDYHNTANAGGGQMMTADLQRRYDEAMQFQQREALIRAHADQLRNAAVVADMPMLQAMAATYEEGWP
jgi:hypothetical protein